MSTQYSQPVTAEEYLTVKRSGPEYYVVTESDAIDTINVSFKACRLSSNGQAIALAGAYFMRAGVIAVWVRVSDEIAAKPIRAIRWFRKMLKATLNEYPGIHRVEAHCVDGLPQHKKLIELCGFKFEFAKRHGFKPNQDLLEFSYIPEVDD